ncbi:MAG: hypothetical protein KJ956_14650 [Actinobacteria bacterium]|nr:hypothetical protein [Actinomycetota bacterium]
MRVTSRLIFERSLQGLHRSWSDIGELQAHIATGKRIHVPSDDPIGSTRAMSARAGLRASEQYQRALDEARLFVASSEAALIDLSDLAIEAQTIAVQLADDATGESGAIALEAKLNQMLEQVVSLGNTEYAGIRIFGGHLTNANPFTATRDAQSKITGVAKSARGTEGNISRLVGRDVLLTINQTGSDLFGEDLEFVQHLVQLRDAAKVNDTETARSLLTVLEEDGDRLNLALATSGGITTRMDSLSEQLDRESLQLASTRSEHEDLDMAKATMDLQIEQTILQAALSATVDVLNLSLVDFL